MRYINPRFTYLLTYLLSTSNWSNFLACFRVARVCQRQLGRAFLFQITLAFVRRSILSSSFPNNGARFQNSANKVHNDLSRSSKAFVFWYQPKDFLYDFLLDLGSNLGLILPRFRESFSSRKPLFQCPFPIPVKISGCSPWSISLKSTESERPRICNV